MRFIASAFCCVIISQEVNFADCVRVSDVALLCLSTSLSLSRLRAADFNWGDGTRYEFYFVSSLLGCVLRFFAVCCHVVSCRRALYRSLVCVDCIAVAAAAAGTALETATTSDLQTEVD